MGKPDSIHQLVIPQPGANSGRWRTEFFGTKGFLVQENPEFAGGGVETFNPKTGGFSNQGVACQREGIVFDFLEAGQAVLGEKLERALGKLERFFPAKAAPAGTPVEDLGGVPKVGFYLRAKLFSLLGKIDFDRIFAGQKPPAGDLKSGKTQEFFPSQSGDHPGNGCFDIRFLFAGLGQSESQKEKRRYKDGRLGGFSHRG